MFLACSRFIFLLAFILSALVMGAALYLEYGLGFEPCLLCLVQRYFLLGFCIVTLMAFIQRPRFRGMKTYSIVSTVLALGGAASALRQVLLQAQAPEQLMFCQPDLGAIWLNLPLSEVVSAIYRGSEACVLTHWSIFDLQVAELSLLAFSGLTVLSSYQIIRALSYRLSPLHAT